MDESVELVLVDDDEMDLRLLEIFCRKAGLCYKSFLDAKKALKYVESIKTPYLLISDISMPTISGFELLLKLKGDKKDAPIVFVSGSGGVENPVRAMRDGAYDFLVKPVRYEIFEARITKAVERALEKEELLDLQDSLHEGHGIENFIGTSQVIKDIYNTVIRVARFDSTVLITGESGVGKERVARAIHIKSERSAKEFVAVNCASIPETLVESELFGYKKGAFTGANSDKIGLIEASSGGILFLDEIGEIPLHLQAKLLRVLQERVVQPVGSNTIVPVDLRVICATHRNLKDMVAKGLFREDLYYRLNVIPIHIPPLRERIEDIKVLIPYLMRKNMERWGEEKTVPKNVLEMLLKHDWPGNVRELENVLERDFVFSQQKTLSLVDFKLTEINNIPSSASIFNLKDSDKLLSLREIELKYISEVMKRSETKDEAARVLGIGRKTLYRKEEQLTEI